MKLKSFLGEEQINEMPYATVSNPQRRIKRKSFLDRLRPYIRTEEDGMCYDAILRASRRKQSFADIRFDIDDIEKISSIVKGFMKMGGELTYQDVDYNMLKARFIWRKEGAFDEESSGIDEAQDIEGNEIEDEIGGDPELSDGVVYKDNYFKITKDNYNYQLSRVSRAYNANYWGSYKSLDSFDKTYKGNYKRWIRDFVRKQIRSSDEHIEYEEGVLKAWKENKAEAEKIIGEYV